MTRKFLPSPEFLRKLLRYEPETGKLFWKERCASQMHCSDSRGSQWAANAWNAKYADKEAFTSVNARGYNQGNIFASNFEAQRICWAIYYLSHPDNEIDHINGIKTDNRICNLRDVTPSENKMNRSRQKNNTSGVTGVMWFKPAKLWVARISKNGKNINLGYFKNFDEAVLVRKNAEKFYGYTERNGK